MRAVIAVLGVLLLVAAVATKASLNPVSWLLFWWRLRLWLIVIGLVALLFAVADSSSGAHQ
jgi:hypothetical protein